MANYGDNKSIWFDENGATRIGVSLVSYGAYRLGKRLIEWRHRIKVVNCKYTVIFIFLSWITLYLPTAYSMVTSHLVLFVLPALKPRVRVRGQPKVNLSSIRQSVRPYAKE